MKVMSILPLNNIKIFHKYSSRVKNTTIPLTKEQMPSLHKAYSSDWIKELSKITYCDVNLRSKCRLYAKDSLRIIAGMDGKSHEKALDLANRLEYCAQKPAYLPKDWSYVLNIYDKDFDFFKKALPHTALSKMEAMYHVKEDLPELYDDFKKVAVTDVIYKFMDIHKEYPEQLKETLNNEKYLNLFDMVSDEGPKIEDIKAFMELMKDDSESINTVLEIFKNGDRECKFNSSSCTVSELIKYVKMMKDNPEATKDILEHYPTAAPELAEVLIKNYDKTDVKRDFEIYSQFINQFNIERVEQSFNIVNPNKKCILKYSLPIDATTVMDLDDFLSSSYIDRLRTLLLNKGKEYRNSKNSLLEEHSQEYIMANADITSFIDNATEFFLVSLRDSKELTRDMLHKDRELFLKLIQDDIYAQYSDSKKYCSVVEEYKKNNK